MVAGSSIGMSIQQPPARYIIVSPVKDEERYVELTLRSVAGQTVKPALWVIVDDGSTDHTAEIVTRYAERYSFIRLVRHPRTGARQTGSAVIRAFQFGCAAIDMEDYDFIVKLDCDLSFAPDYFERLLTRFLSNDRLGIASGVYLEQQATGSWEHVAMPAYHAFGACKVIRKSCFEAIGGFVAAPGWDTVDEIRALNRDWKTGHFVDLPVKHHKREGSGIGLLKTSRMHGEIYYLTGGDPLFFGLKSVHRILSRPFVVGAVALVFGYLHAAVSRKPRLVTLPELRRYRSLLRARLWHKRCRDLMPLSPET